MSNVTCNKVLTEIPAYVSAELSGGNTFKEFPDVNYHIEICSDCEAAYYREFRRQGKLLSALELQQLSGNPSRSALQIIDEGIRSGR